MADQPDPTLIPPLTLHDQAFALLLASMNMWTPDLEDRAFVRDLLRELLPKVNVRHRYLKPMVELARSLLDAETPRAEWSTLNTALSGRVHDFLRWRGLMAYAAAREADEARAAEVVE